MKYKFIDKQIKYDGTQLKSLYAYMEHELMGDSMIAFIGPCDVSFDHMVDGEDLLAGSAIRGGQMLHFIMEEFGINLELAVTRQRLFVSMVFEKLSKIVKTDLRRDGDDIFIGDGKLSISIATVSPVSALIHFAVNVINKNTPVKTACLKDMGVDPKAFADALGESYVQEIKTIKEACCKVRWVK